MSPPAFGDEPMTPAAAELALTWERIRADLTVRVSPTIFEIWLAPLTPLQIEQDGTLVLVAPNDIRAWVAGRFAGRLLQSVQAVLGPEARVDVREPQAAPAAGEAPQAPSPRRRDHELNPKLTFGQFVIGDANRFAHAGALAVAEQPGHAYSPLFLYGPPGVGKTHLLQSIGAYVEAHNPEMCVRYTTAEDFTNDFLGALQSKRSERITSFKSDYRDVDVLLIDDVQFLQRKQRTEEEFFHTFNALQALGGQLVISSDRVPGDLDGVEDRLRERFEAGLVAALGTPDLATRLAILRKRAHHDGLQPADDAVLDVIAQRVATNVRSLEGALIRVVAFASMTGRPLDGELAAEVLDDLYAQSVRPEIGSSAKPSGVVFARAGRRAPAITIALVQELVCETYEVSRDELVSTKRTARLAFARQVAMYLARAHTGETLPAIGRSFGNRNHTTVMHAVKRIEDRLVVDTETRTAVDNLAQRLTDRAD